VNKQRATPSTNNKPPVVVAFDGKLQSLSPWRFRWRRLTVEKVPHAAEQGRVIDQKEQPSSAILTSIAFWTNAVTG
jgi:hypothetical protein